MGILYPNNIDSFAAPTNPANTSLSSAGSSTRAHTQSHQDLGAAIMALETNAAPLAHDHSGTDGSGIWPTNKLAAANTHQSPDTDSGPIALHHTLGKRPFQAAAGNHLHDYAGPEIINKPYQVCTSSTRPLNPTIGTMIFEQDTNTVRVWADFNPNAELQPGLSYGYAFSTHNGTSGLDPSIFSQSYVVGSSPDDGVMTSPSSGNCQWATGGALNVTCRCIAQGVVSFYDEFYTDDQQISFTTGSITLQPRQGSDSPTNDAYLRVSEDGSHYVRFTINDQYASIYYTTNGPTHEVLLGAVLTTTDHPQARWTCQAIGSSYLIYVNAAANSGLGTQVLSAVDFWNAAGIGPGYRDWAIGMTAAAGTGALRVPNNLTRIDVADLPYYNVQPIWQLLNVGNVPHLRAEAHFTQLIAVGGGHVGFRQVLWDWITGHEFMRVDASQFNITIPETGHYSVDAAVVWDPSVAAHSATIAIYLNGNSLGNQVSQQIGATVGYAQTVAISFTYYFTAGNVITVWAQTDEETPARLYWNPEDPNSQTCYASLNFIGP